MESWRISFLTLLYRPDEFPCYTSHQFYFHCSMAKSFHRNFVNPQAYSGNASKLLCTWDFNITNEKAVKLKQKNLGTQIKVQTTGGTKPMCVSHSVGDLFVHTNLCVHVQVLAEWHKCASPMPERLKSSWLPEFHLVWPPGSGLATCFPFLFKLHINICMLLFYWMNLCDY